MVASDRISAFDFVLDTDHPRQGRDPHPDVAVVVRAARRTRRATTSSRPTCPRPSPDAPCLRAARRCSRSSAWPAATSTGSGLRRLPPPPARSAASRCRRGSQDGSRLPEPIFTPATKADLGEHDENVDYEAVVATVGDDAAAELRDADPAGLRPGRGDRPRARHHPRRHQVRVRRRAGRHDRAGRRGADPRLVAASGRPPSGSPAAPRRRTTSRSSATGCCRRSPAGTGRSGEAPPPLPARSWSAPGRRYVEAYELLTGETF